MPGRRRVTKKGLKKAIEQPTGLRGYRERHVHDPSEVRRPKAGQQSGYMLIHIYGLTDILMLHEAGITFQHPV